MQGKYVLFSKFVFIPLILHHSGVAAPLSVHQLTRDTGATAARSHAPSGTEYPKYKCEE